jgi:cytochrome c oxidase subunit 2
VFESNACMNCHAVAGTACGRTLWPRPDSLDEPRHDCRGRCQKYSRQSPLWIQDPSAIKPGSLMPAMKLSDADLDAVVSYMETLR